MTLYLDFAATTPTLEEVATEVQHYMLVEFGNAGSRTHEYGLRAKQRVERAREEVAELAAASPSDVIFTSGATESNNLALLGLADHGLRTGRTHIVATAIEHKAVLEPLEQLQQRGFKVELVAPSVEGFVDPDEVIARVKPETLLVSVMQVNNETGVIQPVDQIADRLRDADVFLHCDAAQGFGKIAEAVQHARVDLISVSGHKLGGPKGVGALIVRRRDRRRAPLKPLMYGGGQERGLRPGTLPVPLIAGLGTACSLAARTAGEWTGACERLLAEALEGLSALDAEPNGSRQQAVPNILNISIPRIDSEAALVALKGLVAISNGSACTSQTYTESHVLTAMGLPPERVRSAIRLSWGATTPSVDWPALVERLGALSGMTAATARYH